MTISGVVTDSGLLHRLAHQQFHATLGMPHSLMMCAFSPKFELFFVAVACQLLVLRLNHLPTGVCGRKVAGIHGIEVVQMHLLKL